MTAAPEIKYYANFQVHTFILGVWKMIKLSKSRLFFSHRCSKPYFHPEWKHS